MPEMDGFALAERIRRRRALARTRVLMLTSGPRPGDERRAIALGVSSYLIKPVKQSDLFERILEALRAPSAQPRQRVPTSRPAGRRLRVLVAEDNEVNQRVAVGMLERAGHRALVDANGRQTLAALAREAFDLVLMDVQMPELDGFETTAAIRERERGTPRRVPIVALTAHAMKGDAERCLAAGMDAYLAKPLQAAELVAVLERLAPDTVIDRARLLERVGGDTRALAEVARIFLADAPRRLREIKHAIDTGDAAGPTELAQQLGLSQGHVSNRLRLLELPEIWQKRVISHEIPASHARSIARYKDSPAILQAIDESIKQSLEWGRSLGSAEDFDKNIDRTAWNATEPISGKRYSSKLGRQFPIFTPTDQEREKLAIIEIPRSNDKSKLEPRATNLNLWDKLQAEHEARLAAKAGSNDKIAMHEPKKPLTAAEKKKIEAARDKERARRLTKGLWELAIDWRQYLIAKDCHDRQVSQEDALRLLIWLGSSRKLFRTNTDFRQRECQFAKILKNCYEITIKYHRADYCLPEPDLFEALINVPDTSVIDLTLDYLGNLIWHPKDGPLLVMPDADVLTIADQLAIQLSAAWEKEAAGPLTERWLNLRNKEALSEMAAKAGINVKAATKAQTIEVIMKHKNKIRPPAELIKPKKYRG